MKSWRAVPAHAARPCAWRIIQTGAVLGALASIVAFVWLSTGGFGVGAGRTAAAAQQPDSTITLTWAQLRDSAAITQLHRVLARSRVRVPGYMIPLDAPGSIGSFEFLLVPYFGACIHTPPPPPNQVVHVRVPAGTRLPWWQPVWIEGELQVESSASRYATAAYTMFRATVESM